MDQVTAWISLIFGGGGLIVLIRQFGPPLVTWIGKWAAPALVGARQAADEAKIKADAATWERASDTITRQGEQIKHLYEVQDAQEDRHHQELRELRSELMADMDALRIKGAKDLDDLRTKCDEDLEAEREKRRRLHQIIETMREEIARLTKENKELRARLGDAPI